MNYYELFNIDQSIDIDEDLLMSRYLELQARYHPDVNDNYSTTIFDVNNGFKVLSNLFQRYKYFLLLNDIDIHKVDIEGDFLGDIFSKQEFLRESNNEQREALLTEALFDADNYLSMSRDKILSNNLAEAGLLLLKTHYLYQLEKHHKSSTR